MTIQTNKTQIKKQKIFNVALGLFFEQGYSQTTIEDIRKAAEVSVGSLYHHFSNKENFADQLYLEVVEDFCKKGNAAILGSKSPEKLIKNWISFHFSWFQKEKVSAHFMMSHQTKPLGRPEQSKLTKIQEDFFMAFATSLEEATKKKTIRITDPSQFFFILIGPTESFSRIWLLQEVGQDVAEVEKAFFLAAQKSLID